MESNAPKEALFRAKHKETASFQAEHRETVSFRAERQSREAEEPPHFGMPAEVFFLTGGMWLRGQKCGGPSTTAFSTPASKRVGVEKGLRSG